MKKKDDRLSGLGRVRYENSINKELEWGSNITEYRDAEEEDLDRFMRNSTGGSVYNEDDY